MLKFLKTLFLDDSLGICRWASHDFFLFRGLCSVVRKYCRILAANAPGIPERPSFPEIDTPLEHRFPLGYLVRCVIVTFGCATSQETPEGSGSD